jgi:MoaA/NifB/PqqE/SkfB family radical SAM enzyme
MSKKDYDSLCQNASFCTLAWTGLSISPVGAMSPCCLFEKSIRESDENIYRIYKDSVEEAYNSPFMRSIREKMLKGEEVEGCKQCYINEAHGGISLRKRANNEHWEQTDDYSLDGPHTPSSLDLKLNNKCNLKCRMCQPRDSHLIHTEFKKIIKEDRSFNNYQNTRMDDPELQIDLDDITDWEDEKEFVKKYTKLLPNIKKIAIVGGEPLLIDAVYKVLDLAVALGYARNIFIVITTNLVSIRSEKIKKYYPHFAKILFNISMDATGKELEYIRYPSKEDKILANLRELYNAPEVNKNIFFMFALTSQAYNALYLVNIFKMIEELEAEGFQFEEPSLSFTHVTYPEHLSIRILPKSIRQAALKRLYTYTQEGLLYKRSEVFRSGVDQIIGALENDYHPASERLFQEFIYYTNSLDQSRGQRLIDYLPELAELIEAEKVIAKKPEMNHFMLREEGWNLAKDKEYIQAIKRFSMALLKSEDKFIDYREMGWIYREMEEFEKSLESYEKAFKLNDLDYHIVEGYLSLAVYLKKNDLVKTLSKHGLKLFPNDESIKKLTI